MDIKALRELEESAYQLSYYVMSLIDLETGKVTNTSDHFESEHEYHLHLGNIAGHYRMEVGRLYNAIAEWQDIP